MFNYSTNVPQAAQKISSTQAPIQSNFQAIAEFLNANHVGFNDSVNYGKHNFTSLPFQGSDPTTLNDEMAIYSKSTGNPNVAEIFYRYPNNGSIVQLTGGGTGASASINGWTYLPNGIIMKWGQNSGIVTGANIITFPTTDGTPPFSTEVYVITFNPIVTYTDAAPSPYISSNTLTTFTITVPNVFSSSVQWMAIGI